MLPLHPASNDMPGGPLYRAVWRWHFYAGIFVAPFAIFLALTGAIYLWKPQYEAWRHRDLLTAPLAVNASERKPVSADAQLAAARAAAPAGWRAQFVQPTFAPGETTQVGFKPGASRSAFGAGLTVYVDPSTGAILGQVRDEDEFMYTVKKLHGTLLAGNTGKYLVELVASWALVLFLTGLYLVWPRPRFTVRGFLLPRLRDQRSRDWRRQFWRDLHAIPAVWFAAGAIFLLSTGLLWTQAAGGWYRKISAAIGQGTPVESNASAHRSELSGWSPPLKAGLAEKIDRLESAPPADEHASHPSGIRSKRSDHRTDGTAPEGPFAGAISLDRVIAVAVEHNVPAPFVIGLPVGPRGVFSAISDRNQPFSRTYLHLDQYSGRVLAEVRFGDFGYLAQFFSWGIIAHEGQLFGLANQILGTFLAAGVALLGASGLVMWWRRRPGRRLAAPTSDARLPLPILLGTLALAALLPLLAASLGVVWVFDRFVIRRAPGSPGAASA